MELEVMVILTQLGNFITWLFAAFILQWRGKAKEARTLTAGLLVCFILSTVLKHLLKLPRPPIEGWLTTVEDPYGFPSGHATIAFFVATYFSLKDKRALILYPMAITVAFTRVALGVHYIHDLIGGALLGIAIAFISNYAEKLNLKMDPKVILALTIPLSIALYVAFPLRPSLASGLTLGLALSYIIKSDGNTLSPLYMLVGLLLAALFLVCYEYSGLVVVEVISSCAFILYPLSIHPKIYESMLTGDLLAEQGA